MAREQKDFRSDFKLKVTFYELNPDYDPEVPIGVDNEMYVIVDPTEVPFVINLFSTNGEKRIEKTLFQATWDLTTATNCKFIDNNTKVLVIFNNDPALRLVNKGLFEIGMLHGTVWYGYPDSEMPDDTFNCGNPFDTNIDIINIDTVEDFETQLIRNEPPYVKAGIVTSIVGKDGSLIYTGSGVPSNEIGVFTDVYIDNVAPNNYYQKDATNVWVLKGSLQGASGDDGREVLIQNNGTYIQWQYEGDLDWTNIILVSDLKGDKGDKGGKGDKGDTGANIELQKSSTHIQWRVVGDTNWIDLVALSDLKGDAGRGIVSFNLINTVGKTKTYRLLYTDDTYVDINIIDGNDGVDGLTPYIGMNGNWWIGDVDQNIKAEGVDGVSPTIGMNGNWYLGTTDTGVKAQGADGYTPQKGVDYFDGITPTIGLNKHWYIGAIDTGIVAEGQDGEDGVTPIITIGENENWYINGADSGKPSRGANGTSAYQIYVAGGGTLSEVDYNASITEIPSHISDETIHHTIEELDEVYESLSNKKTNLTDNSDVFYPTQKAVNTALDLKIDKTAIKQALGTSTTDVMSQKAVTEAIMKAHDYDINFFAYGVSRDLTGTGQTLTRVGNLSLHKTRPILRKSIGCVKNAQGVQYYLDNNTDFLKADGVTPSVLDGTDGDVMTEIPEMYVYEYTEGDYEYTYLSEFPLPNFKRIPKTYHGRYEGSYDTTTNQLCSVINSNIRGGLPATGQSVFYYNSGAIKDRNLDWSPDRLLSHYVRGLLFRVHYATYDSQATFNSALTAEGYLQGGLGTGVSDINYNKWRYNGYNPFIPCGYTAELGNKTGVKYFYMPYEYDGWSSVAGDNTGYYKGIYNAGTAYNVGEYVADNEDTSIGLGDGKLYKCIQQTTAGIPLTNTTYFALQARTKTQVNRFLVEIPFGHTFKQTIDCIIELTNNYTTTKCYVYDNPAHFTDTKTANARFLCNMPSEARYIKLFNNYTIVPYSIGGSSGSWGYDYFYWRGEAGGALRGLLFGGAADSGSYAGLWFSYSAYSPSLASTYFGVRLCCFLEGSKIE